MENKFVNECHALLIVDRRFVMLGGDWYTLGAAGPETGSRYLSYFPRVVVAGRRWEGEIPPLSQMTKLDARLNVVLLPDISGLRNRLRNLGSMQRSLYSLIDDCNLVILRLPSEFGFEAVKYCKKSAKPVAVDLGTCAFDTYWNHGSFVGKIYAPIAMFRQKAALRAAKYVSYVSQEYLQRTYGNSQALTICCSNVELPSVDEAVLQSRLKRIIRIGSGNSGPLRFGTIGSLVGKLKGIRDALKALSRIRSELGDFEYWVVGPGNPDPYVRMAIDLGISEHIRFFGALPSGSEVLGWLDEIDVYLHPSRREGVPRAVIEAMSRGCPVIASNVGGTSELLPVDCLHRPGDIESLQRRIMVSLSQDWQYESAIRNWRRACDFNGKDLSIRRAEFWRRVGVECGLCVGSEGGDMSPVQ